MGSMGDGQSWHDPLTTCRSVCLSTVIQSNSDSCKTNGWSWYRTSLRLVVHQTCAKIDDFYLGELLFPLHSPPLQILSTDGP